MQTTFNPQSAEFQWTAALAMAVDANRAYAALPADAVAITNPLTSADAYVWDRGDHVVVAFRGSQQTQDFLQDIKCWLETLPAFDDEHPTMADLLQNVDTGAIARVHAGFLADWESIDEAVLHAVKNCQPSLDKPIWVTGHSLGGAIATLCAMEFYRLKLPVKAVYTFGSPRVGNAAFASLYNSMLQLETFRLVNQNDIVPRTPGWLMGYRHVGTEIFIEPIFGWVKNPGFTAKLFYDALGLYRAYSKRQEVLVHNHFIESYYERISKITAMQTTTL